MCTRTLPDTPGTTTWVVGGSRAYALPAAFAHMWNGVERPEVERKSSEAIKRINNKGRKEASWGKERGSAT